MIYAKRVQTTDPRFSGRSITISLYPARETIVIPIPDTSVPCYGCTQNIYPDAGYLIYLDEQDLAEDLPYDFYCDDCRKKYFPESKEVGDES